ncbi:MAG TPA: protein kinase, partial [Gemmatimonadales bacterium]|nr:protein kinase [Gemmatimonadales bacterium]
MDELFDGLKAALADRYTLERPLGTGGMATVYLARDVRHNRQVAIKVLLPDLAALIGAERFLKEIETTANLQHPHILPLFDSGHVNGTVFYVMPYVQGESLRGRLQREVQLPVAEAIRIAGEIGAALDYAHRQGVIHRDVKPDNVLLHDGRVMVADFGLALARTESGEARLTRAGVRLGTPEYMSPEQAAGDHDVDGRTDIYALGVCVYEMLTGRRPFTGLTARAVLNRILSDPPAPIAAERKTVPPHVEAAVLGALEKLPADRWQTATEFVEALKGTRPVHLARAGVPLQAAAPWALSGILLAALGTLWFQRAETPRGDRTPVRFSIELGSGVEPTFTPIVRLSPDGRQLFVTAMVNRREEILRHEMDRDGMQLIANAGLGELATGNSRPFVSPDGKWVAYFRQGRLMKVPVAGGPAIDLAWTDWAGGSWGRNGRIIYTRTYSSGLWMVDENGGDEHQLTAPDTARGELGHWWPQILPDGDHVLFTAYRTPTEQATIEVLTLSTGRRKVVLTGGVFGFYVPTGHLLYAVGETIRAARFDLGRLEVTGPPVAVVDSVAMNATDGAAAFDVSENGTLAYMPVSSYVTETEVVLVDRQGKATLALPLPDRYDHPRLSPDGSRIAVDIRAANSLGDIWMFQLGRRGGIRLTAAAGRDFGATWTPDGQELVFSSERPFYDLYRRAADASRPEQPLLTGGYDHYVGTASRDGELLAYELSVPGGSEIWTVHLRGDTAPSRYLANGFNLAHPALSPDGRWMAYDSDESGRVEVFIQSFPDPRRRRWKVSPVQGSEPMWTRGGRELVYRNADSVMAVSVDPEDGQSSAPRLLFAGPYPDNPGWTRPRSYDVSADG